MVPPLNKVTALRIACTRSGCRAEVTYYLRATSEPPSECPSCKQSWGSRVATFREALMGEIGPGTGGHAYALHLEFGTEPYNPVP